jgi:hypothetical protein
MKTLLPSGSARETVRRDGVATSLSGAVAIFETRCRRAAGDADISAPQRACSPSVRLLLPTRASTERLQENK